MDGVPLDIGKLHSKARKSKIKLEVSAIRSAGASVLGKQSSDEFFRRLVA